MLPDVRPLVVSVAEEISTASSLTYTISPVEISGASPGSSTVMIKLFSVNLTNLCVPKGSCAANVIVPPEEDAVVTKSLLKKYLILLSSGLTAIFWTCLLPVGKISVPEFKLPTLGRRRTILVFVTLPGSTVSK